MTQYDLNDKIVKFGPVGRSVLIDYDTTTTGECNNVLLSGGVRNQKAYFQIN